MANYKVNQRKRVVTAYTQSLSKSEREDLEYYKSMDYKIDLLDRKTPRKNTKASREDLSKYLCNGVISKEIYEELKKHIDNKENILTIKSWLNKALMEEADKNNKTEFLDFENYIISKKAEAEKQEQDKIKKFQKKVKLNKFMKDTDKN